MPDVVDPRMAPFATPLEPGLPDQLVERLVHGALTDSGALGSRRTSSPASAAGSGGPAAAGSCAAPRSLSRAGGSRGRSRASPCGLRAATRPRRTGNAPFSMALRRVTSRGGQYHSGHGAQSSDSPQARRAASLHHTCRDRYRSFHQPLSCANTRIRPPPHEMTPIEQAAHHEEPCSRVHPINRSRAAQRRRAEPGHRDPLPVQLGHVPQHLPGQPVAQPVMRVQLSAEPPASPQDTAGQSHPRHFHRPPAKVYQKPGRNVSPAGQGQVTAMII
jgi:hypothetical protein